MLVPHVPYEAWTVIDLSPVYVVSRAITVPPKFTNWLMWVAAVAAAWQLPQSCPVPPPVVVVRCPVCDPVASVAGVAL